MKRFLRKMNRGLILAAVVLVGVVIFVTVDNARFKHSKPVIQKQVEEYLEEVKRVNLEPGEEKVDQARKLLEQYWCDGSNGMDINYSRMAKEEGLSYLKRVKEQGGDRKQVLDYTDMVRSVKIVKNGPGCAKAMVEYEASIGFEKELGEDGYPIYGLQGDGYYFFGSVKKEEDGKRLNVSYTLSFLLYEKDGQWKISSADYSEPDDQM